MFYHFDHERTGLEETMEFSEENLREEMKAKKKILHDLLFLFQDNGISPLNSISIMSLLIDMIAMNLERKNENN